VFCTLHVASHGLLLRIASHVACCFAALLLHGKELAGRKINVTRPAAREELQEVQLS
jgi:hypothetical protein